MCYPPEVPIRGGPCTFVLIEGLGRLPILAGKVSSPRIIHEPVIIAWDVRVVEMMIIAFSDLIKMTDIYIADVVDRVIVVFLLCALGNSTAAPCALAGGDDRQ